MIARNMVLAELSDTHSYGNQRPMKQRRQTMKIKLCRDEKGFYWIVKGTCPSATGYGCLCHKDHDLMERVEPETVKQLFGLKRHIPKETVRTMEWTSFMKIVK